MTRMNVSSCARLAAPLRSASSRHAASSTNSPRVSDGEQLPRAHPGAVRPNQRKRLPSRACSPAANAPTPTGLAGCSVTMHSISGSGCAGRRRRRPTRAIAAWPARTRPAVASVAASSCAITSIGGVEASQRRRPAQAGYAGGARRRRRVRRAARSVGSTRCVVAPPRPHGRRRLAKRGRRSAAARGARATSCR